MLDDILAGVGGALTGGLKGYEMGKDRQLKERAISSREEIARLRDEIRLMIAQMNEGGRADRHEEPSGSVVAQQEGANLRAGMVQEGQNFRFTAGDQTRRRGQDLYNEQSTMRDLTTRRGQDFGFDLGVMRDGTTRRGQDISSTTTRRGQDVTKLLGMNAEGGRNTRATDANALREQEMESRERIARQRRSNPFLGVDFAGSGLPVTEIKEETGTGKPTAKPIEVKETTGTLPVSPRSPEAGADQMQRLEQQAQSLFQQFQRETDPAKKAALASQLQRLRAQREAALKKGAP